MPSTCRTAAGRFKKCGRRAPAAAHLGVVAAVKTAVKRHSKAWGGSSPHVYAKGKNRGGWAPRALATVNVEEAGLPGPSTGPFSGENHWLDWWIRVGNTASQLHGKPLYFEHVNDAIVAVYPG